MLASRKTVANVSEIRATIAESMLAGANKPYQTVMFTPLRSGCSARLGKSGASGERVRSLAPKIFTEPLR